MPEEELVAGMVKIAKGFKVAGQKPTIVEIMRAREWLADRGHGKAPAFALIEGENPLELTDLGNEIAATLDDLAEKRAARAAGGSEAPPLAGTGETVTG